MAWSWCHTDEAYDNAEFNLRNRRTKKWIVECWVEWIVHLYEQRQKARSARYFDEAPEDLKDEEMDGYWQSEPEWTQICPYTWREGGIYKGLIKLANKKLKNELATEVLAWASEAATCDNGGFNAWMCPSGCHQVSFDKERK